MAGRIDEGYREEYARTLFGFWLYIMSDCILFSVLFATYAVLRHHTFGGPTARELFSAPFALTETLVLLVSSFACGLGRMAAHQGHQRRVLGWFGAAWLLGFTFLVLEGREFAHLVDQGDSWRQSAFLSAFFTLVGTHGAHVTVGLFWMLVMMLQVQWNGLTLFTLRRLTCLSLFWHFLDVVWIFIFTVVYLMGVI